MKNAQSARDYGQKFYPDQIKDISMYGQKTT